VATAQISKVNCDEMDKDRSRQPANSNCMLGCRAFHELCSNYLYFCCHKTPKTITFTHLWG